MTTTDVEAAAVYEVKPGSLIVLNEMDDDELMGEFVDEIKKATGHDRFVVLALPHGGGSARVFGPEELKAALRQALDA